jgi:hypothetical protein
MWPAGTGWWAKLQPHVDMACRSGSRTPARSPSCPILRRSSSHHCKSPVKQQSHKHVLYAVALCFLVVVTVLNHGMLDIVHTPGRGSTLNKTCIETVYTHRQSMSGCALLA